MANADYWRIIDSDDTCALIHVEYRCPECGEWQDYNTIATGNIDALEDGDIYLDTHCEDCGAAIELECDEDACGPYGFEPDEY